VDVADVVGAGERVDVAVVLEILRGVLEALAAGLLLRDVVLADGRAHGAVDDDDALGERLAEGGFSGAGLG
jgi:hypothetical protein